MPDIYAAALLAGQAAWRKALGSTAGLRQEIGRRAALAREPNPDGVRAPSLGLLLGELAILGRRGRKDLAIKPAKRPQPVMLLPGFGANPARMKNMEEALNRAGHSAYDWGLGTNLGPTPENFAFLMRRLGTLSRIHGQPVVLVGWSLGGLFAREIARRQPQHVGRVITLGTPFSGHLRANNAWRAYHLIAGHAVEQPPIEDCDFREKPPVPTIALWSPRDGVIHPRSACGWPGERDRAVALRCTHLGFAGDPAVIAEVLHQIDRED